MNFLKRFFSKESRQPRVNIKQRFELIGRVGQGSMSKVWRARDLNSGRTVALKVLHKQKTEELEARFVGLDKPKEGDIAVQFQHPHIVKTFEHGLTTDGEQFLVMEFIEGYSLSFLVEAQNEDMRTNCLKYMIQLGEAIQYFHTENWIHRDICPRNIMVDNEQQLKLIDFGLVVPNTPPFLQPGNRTGTAAYMAPELIKRQKTSQKIDIFSYAVTCYEMLTKRLPWKAAETMEAVLQHINSPPKPIQELLPGINPILADAIMKGLELYPQDRWQTIDEMLAPFKEVYQSQKTAVSQQKTETTISSTPSPTSTVPGKKRAKQKSDPSSKRPRSSQKSGKTPEQHLRRRKQKPPMEGTSESPESQPQPGCSSAKEQPAARKNKSSRPKPGNPDESH
ncbi:serine/threonine protein kinase [Gimesia algae]|uniref:Serine/threonine-protein kinase PknB n=1 Tax=Gimesia algae TaxID=2527971 RepID=A0A517V8K9_9PLAN|nr:serine/threonine-protein kinase [Gimesia algae]QDT89329.1 Serine/threonine-protein kinase PknB [Gimesia algae]